MQNIITIKSVEDIGLNKLINFPMSKQEIQDLTWTQYGRYCVAKDDHSIFVDIYNPSNDFQVQFEGKRNRYFGNKQIYYIHNKIIYTQQGTYKKFCFSGQSLDSKNKQIANLSKIKLQSVEAPSNFESLYFHQSQSLYLLSLNKICLFVYNIQTGQKNYLPSKLSIIGLGDSQSLIIVCKTGILDCQSKQITLFDLRTQQLKTVIIPHELPFDISSSSFFLIDNNQAVVGIHMKQCYQIFIVELKQSGNIKSVLRLFDISKQIGDVTFLTMNKHNMMMAIRIITAKQSHQKIILLNLMSGEVYWQHKLSQFSRDENKGISLKLRIKNYSKRFSKNLQSYLAIVKPQKRQVLQSQLFGFKKIHFHIFKKSNLFQKFGQGMGRILMNRVL